MNKRRIGAGKEARAAAFLEEAHCRILERNFRCRIGEIDLIAWDTRDGMLVFAEVKYRKDATNGLPEEAVNFAKQQKICRVADYYRMMRHIKSGTACRFDVLAIEGEEIRHIRNAFPYLGDF